ncbi:hypothetical protein [Aliihoeflea sp. PC F10.4]
MSRFVTYLVRFVAILVGFIGACLTASLFVNLLFASSIVAIVPELSQAGPALYVTVPFFALIIANMSFGVFMIAAVAAELLSWRSWLAHAGCGAVVGLYTGWRFAEAMDRPDAASDAGLMLVTLAAGLIGGIAYWAIAGRNAGNWRDEVTARLS